MEGVTEINNETDSVPLENEEEHEGPMKGLFPELLTHIFRFLDVRDKGRAAQTCRYWRDIVYQRSIWRNVEAKMHLKKGGNQVVYQSLSRRGIDKIQVLSLKRSLKELVGSTSRLQSLKLSGCYNVTDFTLSSAFGGSSVSSVLSTLTILNLSLCKQISDVSLLYISRASNLKVLELGGCCQITDRGLLLISWGLKKLTRLNCRSCSVTDTGIGFLAGEVTQAHLREARMNEFLVKLGLIGGEAVGNSTSSGTGSQCQSASQTYSNNSSSNTNKSVLYSQSLSYPRASKISRFDDNPVAAQCAYCCQIAEHQVGQNGQYMFRIHPSRYQSNNLLLALAHPQHQVGVQSGKSGSGVSGCARGNSSRSRKRTSPQIQHHPFPYEHLALGPQVQSSRSNDPYGVSISHGMQHHHTQISGQVSGRSQSYATGGGAASTTTTIAKRKDTHKTMAGILSSSSSSGSFSSSLAKIEPGVSEFGTKELRHLCLQDCQKLTDDALSYIGSGLKKLESINLSFCVHLSDTGLRHLAQIPSLTDINLRSCRITNSALANLNENGKGCKLRALDVSFCEFIGDTGLNHIASGMPNLTSLSVSACEISDVGLSRIALSLKDLDVLNLGQCSKITDNSIKTLIEKCSKLKYMDLYGCTSISAQVVNLLMTMPNMKTLNLGLWHVR